MQTETLRDLILQTLEDMKVQNIQILDVRNQTQVTDYMIIATGTSIRHLQAVAEHVHETMKNHHIRTLGTEGGDKSDWVLIDLLDVVCHIMTAQAREFYDLERLWLTTAKQCQETAVLP